MPSTSQRYQRGYKYLKIHSTDKQVIKSYLAQEFPKHFKTAGRSKIQILDIGSADGDITQALLQNISCPQEQIELNLVEPSESAMKEALAHLRDYRPQAFTMSYADYLKETHNQKKYDLVFAGHSLYHTGLHSLEPMIDSLKEGGFLFVIISSIDSEFVPLQKYFPNLGVINGKRAFAALQAFPARQLFKEVRSKSLDIRPCVDSRGALTEAGKDLASVLALQEFENFNPDQQQALTRFFAERQPAGAITNTNDFIWFQK